LLSLRYSGNFYFRRKQIHFMKKSAFLSSVLFLFLAVGCQKEEDKPPTPSKEDLLVDKNWYASDITFVSGDFLRYYKRGGSGNTWDFTNDYISFKRDGTGTYQNLPGSTFNISWQFIDAAKTRIRFTIFDYDKGVRKPGTNLVVNWQNVLISANAIEYSEIYTNSDSKSIISAASRMVM